MKLEVVTPQGQLVSSEIDALTAPGALGEFGVLPGHIPFISAIRPGVVRFQHGHTEGVLAVGPGFLEVSAEGRVVLLTQQGIARSEIVVDEARHDRDGAQKKLDHWEGSQDDPARASVEAERDWAQAQLDAAGSTAPAAH